MRPIRRTNQQETSRHFSAWKQEQGLEEVDLTWLEELPLRSRGSSEKRRAATVADAAAAVAAERRPSKKDKQKAKQRKKKGDQAAAAAGGEASDSALGASASGVDVLKEAAEAASAALAARKEAVSWYIDHAESIHDAASDLEARLHKAAELEAARKAIAESECMTRAVYARCLRVLLDSDEIDGQDVLHIISSSKGGADHPDNYLYAPSYTSGRPLAVVGDYDSLTAFAAGKAKTVKAIRVSRMFGNRISPDHDVIDAKGKAVKYYQPQHSQDDEAEADWLYSMGQKLMAASQAPPLGAV